MLVNIILIVVILLIVVLISLYLYKAKKSGSHCVGCPYSKQCGSKTCNCNSKENQNKKPDKVE